MKSKKLGIQGTCLKWIQNYMEEWFQYVEVNKRITVSSFDTKQSYKSHMLEVKKGVPKGFILGPLLFIYIYI